jgi:hypothetical protein
MINDPQRDCDAQFSFTVADILLEEKHVCERTVPPSLLTANTSEILVLITRSAAGMMTNDERDIVVPDECEMTPEMFYVANCSFCFSGNVT